MPDGTHAAIVVDDEPVVAVPASPQRPTCDSLPAELVPDDAVPVEPGPAEVVPS